MKQSISEGFEVAGLGIGSIVLILVLIAGLSFGGFYAYAYFQPKYVGVQYKTFKQSQQYNDGMANRLEQYQEAYDQCTTAPCRDNIASMVKHDFASYNADLLPSQLRGFYDKMESQ